MLLTLPDLAAMYPTSIIIFTLMGIDGPDHLSEQQMVMFYLTTPPSIVMMIAMAIVGLLGARHGAARMLSPMVDVGRLQVRHGLQVHPQRSRTELAAGRRREGRAKGGRQGRRQVDAMS